MNTYDKKIHIFVHLISLARLNSETNTVKFIPDDYCAIGIETSYDRRRAATYTPTKSKVGRRRQKKCEMNLPCRRHVRVHDRTRPGAALNVLADRFFGGS